MCAKWIEKSESSVDVLLQQLNNPNIYNSSGVSGLKSFEFGDYLTTIEPYIIFNKEIPQLERFNLLRKAALNLSKNGQIVSKQLLGELTKEENYYLNQPKENYILAGSISIQYLNELKKTVINKTPITFSRYLPKQYNQKSAIDEWKSLKLGDVPSLYTSTRISVKARTLQEAYDQAMDSLDLLRGIWNIYLTKDVLFTFGGDPSPINPIRLGPMQTIHFPNGKPAPTGIFWYEPDYVEKVQRLNHKWNALSKFEKQTKNYLVSHSYKSDVEDSIRRYTRALDHKDLHISFLELWINLEKLTATTFAKYDVMIKRVGFIYQDNILHTELMRSLKHFRNESVHSAKRSELIERRVYQLKRFVEKMLFFHITNPFKFKSLNEAAEFLDLPASANELKKRSEDIKKDGKLIKKAIKYRH